MNDDEYWTPDGPPGWLGAGLLTLAFAWGLMLGLLLA